MQQLSIYECDKFTRAYIECALWSSTDDEGDPLDANHSTDELPQETLAAMVKDCQEFQATHEKLLSAAYTLSADYDASTDKARGKIQSNYDASSAGHDFWLTRNGHGAGFWDRGLRAIGDSLAATCGHGTKWPGVDLYIGDDGLIYQY